MWIDVVVLMCEASPPLLAVNSKTYCNLADQLLRVEQRTFRPVHRANREAKDETHPNSDAWHWWSPPPNVPLGTCSGGFAENYGNTMGVRMLAVGSYDPRMEM